jgi:hypothetical protein
MGIRGLCTVWPEPKDGNTQKYEVRDLLLDEMHCYRQTFAFGSPAAKRRTNDESPVLRRRGQRI